MFWHLVWFLSFSDIKVYPTTCIYPSTLESTRISGRAYRCSRGPLSSVSGGKVCSSGLSNFQGVSFTSLKSSLQQAISRVGKGTATRDPIDRYALPLSLAFSRTNNLARPEFLASIQDSKPSQAFHITWLLPKSSCSRALPEMWLRYHSIALRADTGSAWPSQIANTKRLSSTGTEHVQ